MCATVRSVPGPPCAFQRRFFPLCRHPKQAIWLCLCRFCPILSCRLMLARLIVGAEPVKQPHLLYFAQQGWAEVDSSLPLVLPRTFGCGQLWLHLFVCTFIHTPGCGCCAVSEHAQMTSFVGCEHVHNKTRNAYILFASATLVEWVKHHLTLLELMLVVILVATQLTLISTKSRAPV